MLGLLLVAGCNQFWDLGPVELRGDGGGDASPDLPRIRLTTQIAQTRAQGQVDPVLAYGPISPPPTVQIGPYDPTEGELVGATYEANGDVAYPKALVGKKWRLVYTLEDGISREVQWSPPEGDRIGHIVELLIGRAERLPVPAGGGYKITPVGSPGQHQNTRVFTTGLWTEGIFAGMIPPGPTLDYDFGARARSLSGPLGAPEQAKLDRAVLADFQIADGCRSTTGVATFVVPDLAGGLTAPDPQPAYLGADKQAILTLGGPVLIDSRLQSVLGTRGGGVELRRMAYGYAPSLDVFGFSKPVPEQALEFLLPGPRMIAFATCTISPGAGSRMTGTFADPAELRELFPRVVHVEIADQRMVGAVALTSGFSAVVTSSNLNFTSEFLVAAPTAVKLHRGGAPIADLAGDLDGAVLPAGGGPLELTFEVEPNALLGADAFDVTLYRLSIGTLTRQRIYTVTDRAVAIDPSFLLPDNEYVFEIRAYRGRPEAARANFSVHTYPQYAATVFTRTFRTPP